MTYEMSKIKTDNLNMKHSHHQHITKILFSLTEVLVTCVVTSCSDVAGYHFGGSCYLHLQDGILPHYNMVSAQKTMIWIFITVKMSSLALFWLNLT